MTHSDPEYRPTVDDVDPNALAVNSVDDQVRVSADPSETEIADAVGETIRVDDEADGGRVSGPRHVVAGESGTEPSDQGEAR